MIVKCHSFYKVYQYLHLYKFQAEKGCWLWRKPPPPSKKPVNMDPIDETKIKADVAKARRVSLKINDKLLKGIGSLVITIQVVSF